MSTVLVGEILSVAMFLATIAVVLAGYPVAFTLAGIALIFAALGWSAAKRARVGMVLAAFPQLGEELQMFIDSIRASERGIVR